MDRLLGRLPASLLAVGVIAGILICDCRLAPGLSLILAGCGTLFLTARRHPAMIIGLGLCIGILSAEFLGAPAPDTAVHRPVTDTWTAVATADGLSAGEVMLEGSETVTAVQLPHDSRGLEEGYRYRISGTMRPLRTIADLPYERIPHTGAIARGARNIIHADSITEIGDARSVSKKIRDAVGRALLTAGADDNAYELYTAILTGERSALTAESRERFAAAGVAHVLALSGFHVGFIALIAGLLLFPLNLTGRHLWLRQVGIVAAIWGFAWCVGMGATVVRAAIMATALYLGRITGRQVSSWNSLCLAVALILALDPEQLYSVGLQLSVLAVAGLLTFAPLLNPVTPRRHKTYLCAQAVAVPIAAVVATAPLTAYYFHDFPPYFLLANIPIALIFPWLMGVGLLLAITGSAGLTIGPLATCANQLAGAVDSLTEAIASLPTWGDQGLFIESTAVAGLLLFIFSAGAALHLKNRKALLTAVPIGCAGLLLSLGCSRNLPRAEAYIVPLGTNTSVVMAVGDETRAFVTAGARYADNAARSLRSCTRDYVRYRGGDSLRIEAADFDFGPYHRRGQFFIAGPTVTAIPAGRGIDSVGAHVDYVLLTNRCRSAAADVLRRQRPDTLLISPDASARLRADFMREAIARGIPIICLDTATVNFPIKPAHL